MSGEIAKRLNEISKTVRLNGFRPGKVPLRVVKQQFGDQVRQEVQGDLIQKTFFEAAKQESLNPAGMPSIEAMNDTDDGFEYIAQFEVMPTVESVDLSEVTLTEIDASVTDKDVEDMIETLRTQHASWDSVERGAETGDRVSIDYHGTIDGEDFQGNSGKDVPVTIGAQRMIAGFEDGVIGATAGSELSLDLVFPEDYAFKEVAGKPVQFSVKVNKVEAPSLPELEEEFISKFGVDDGSVDTFTQEIRSNMERELESRVRADIKEQVMEKLVEVSTLEVPQALVEQEAQALMQRMQQEQGNHQLTSNLFEPQAKRRVTLGMLIEKIISDQGLVAAEEKVDEKLQALSASYEAPEEVINYYKSDKQRLAEIESLVLEEEVVEWAKSVVKIEKSERSFKDVMGQHR